ncbi:MAG: DNA polymerase domain-containing protein, partial [Candidatus Aenigmatarchaeota archaeon]
AFDIEVAEEEDEEKIIMISLKDSRGFEKVLTYKRTGVKGVMTAKDEADLLKRFVKIVQERNPDIICGYNTDRFDFLKLDARAAKHKVPLKLGKDGKDIVFRRRGRISSARMMGRVHVDLYDFVEHILAQSLTSDVLTLDRVSKEILGMGKEAMKWKEIEEAWKEKRGLKKLVEYCRWDSELALKLAYRLLPQMYEMCKITGQILFDASRMTYSQLVESVLIREAFRAGELVQNRPKYDEVQRRRAAEPYAGAYVHLPKEGIHDGVAVFDFRSLYPSIIVSHNVSPETLDCSHKTCQKNRVPELQHCFCTKQTGFIPAVLERVIKKRIEVKKQMTRLARTPRYKELFNRQFGLKILANSLYGYYGYAGSRWYSRLCARSITAWGRYYIKTVIGMAEKAGRDVLYGDTDSLFLKIKNKSEAKAFLKNVNKNLPGIMELEFKGMYKRGIFIEAKTGIAAKKKYALLDEAGNLIMRGMETRRRDWAKIAKDTQEKVLEAILKDKSVEKAMDIVNQTVRQLRKGQVDFDDLVIYTQLTKPLSQYEQLGPHVKAAKKA